MRDKQISMFDKEKYVSIEKGIRFFDKPCSMDICEAFVKVQKDEIAYQYGVNHSREKFINPTWEFEILNIRAESKVSRDLMQDLQDIKEGIEFTHASDEEKRTKEFKHKKRETAKQKKIEKIEKRILEIGYCNMEPYEQERCCKYLDFDRIDELEAIREENLKKEQEKPVQLSLFD